MLRNLNKKEVNKELGNKCIFKFGINNFSLFFYYNKFKKYIL